MPTAMAGAYHMPGGDAPVRRASLAIFALSALAILGAFGFEHLGGLRPCPLCLDQRLAYYAAMPASLLALAFARSRNALARVLLALCAAAFVINTGLGVYHAGIEWGWWPGPANCAGQAPLAADPAALVERLKQIRVVRCDEAPFRFLGLSLAGYSALLSAALALAAMAGAAHGARRSPAA